MSNRLGGKRAIGLMMLLVSPICAQDLPSESSLPPAYQVDRVFPSESTIPPYGGRAEENRTAWPSESTIPATYRQQDKTPPDKNPPDKNPPDKNPQGVGDAKNGLLQEGERVWLRLNQDGHHGVVRSIRFGTEGDMLFSAGEDKVVRVWNALAQQLPETWRHSRVVRWQVQRGPNGRIYALDGDQKLLAMAGHGAMGAQGEILLVDPIQGEVVEALFDFERGHRQVISGLAMNRDRQQPRVVSIDRAGQINHWSRNPKTGIWSFQQIQPPDREVHPTALASKLAERRRFTPVVFSRPNQTFLPRYVSSTTIRGREVLRWTMDLVDLSTGRRRRSAAIHTETVTAVAVSADGRTAATADLLGLLVLWDVQNLRPISRHSLNAVPLSLHFNPSGNLLAVGTGQSPRLNGKAQVQLWNVADASGATLLREKSFADHVYSVRFRPRGAKRSSDQLAYTQGTTIDFVDDKWMSLGRLSSDEPTIQRVAFSSGEDDYRLVVTRRPAKSPNKSETSVFNLRSFELSPNRPAAPKDAEGRSIPADFGRGQWRIRVDGEPGAEQIWLYRNEQRAARIPLQPTFGLPQSVCWIPAADGSPFAVAIGTDGRDGIYVFRLAIDGVAQLIREFRGHESTVTSLGVSRDRRYLVSASNDTTIRIWSLIDLHNGSWSKHRWGAEFQVVNGRLEVASSLPGGPLHYQGVRTGDRIAQVDWFDKQLRQAKTPVTTLQSLRELDHKAIIKFQYERAQIDQPAFQSYPAWRPLLTLSIASDREWAAWTTDGYYDASFNGHRRFGWQINRGVDRKPEFFLAAQLRKSLERPKMMRHLLNEGSVEGAFEASGRIPPANAIDVVFNEYQLSPKLRILTPQHLEETAGERVTLRAAIESERGLALIPPKAFANGVLASRRTIEKQQTTGTRQTTTYEWDVAMPADSQMLLQVVASSESEAVAIDSRRIVRVQAADPASDDPPDPAPIRKMLIVAAGVNRYRDAQIQQLDYAVSNVQTLVDTLRERAASIYDVESIVLTNDDVSPGMWRSVTSTYSELLTTEFGPDDVVLFLFSGHGVSDPGNGDYYFVTANARYQDLANGRYEECVSLKDLDAFKNVSCRKLVVLDTCHSGAIQPARLGRELKSALRLLQNDYFLTVTASEGTQEAIEDRDRQLGRFTYRWNEAMLGAADKRELGGNADGVVTFTEAVRYVKSTVPGDGKPNDKVQFPTAAPAELLPLVEIPLTSSRGR